MGSFEIPNQTYDIEDFMNKQEVKNLIKKERELYLNKANNLNIIKMWYTHEPIYEIWRFVYWLRKCEFYNKRKNIPSKIALAYCRKKKNLYGTYSRCRFTEKQKRRDRPDLYLRYRSFDGS